MRKPRRMVSYGPAALLLEWEQVIDLHVNRSVHAYARAVRAHPAVTKCVAGYASLLVRFAAPKVRAYDLREFIYDLRVEPWSGTGARHELEVVYDGPDLGEVTELTGLSEAEIIERHTGRDHHVFLLGFVPGFAFLGPTDEQLRVPRRSEPRQSVPAGSVGLAGLQTGIYPGGSPGGWQLIGRLIDPLPSFEIGDTVRFRSNGIPLRHVAQKFTDANHVDDALS